MKLFHESFGHADRNTVVLLHGSGAPPASLRKLAKALSDTHHVVLPHRNGYGETGVHDYDADAELDALLELVDGPFAIVGHSFGAFRAFQLAARAPERVERIAALGPIARLPEEAREAVEGLVVFIRSGADLSEAATARWITPDYLQKNPGIIDSIRSWLGEVDSEIMALENLETLDGGETLEGLAAASPSLAMYVGEIDQATPPELADAIAARVEGATVTRVPAMGHLPMVEDFNATVDWLKGALKE